MNLQIVLSTVIAVVASLAFLLAGFNALLSPIKTDMAKLDMRQEKLELRIKRLETGQEGIRADLVLIKDAVLKKF